MSSQSLNQPAAGQFLTFKLKEQSYGVPIETVREINRVSEITPVPQTPEFVAGVMNLRGKVIPVIDLRLKLGMVSTSHTKETCIIVIETDNGQVGTIVDVVVGVVDLVGEQIEPPPKLGERSTPYIMGMGKQEKLVMILLDEVRCLSQLDLSGLEQLQNEERKVAS